MYLFDFTRDSLVRRKASYGALRSFRRRAHGIKPAADEHLRVPLSAEMPRAIPVRSLGTPLMDGEFQVAAIDHEPVHGILRHDAADFAFELFQCRHRNRNRRPVVVTSTLSKIKAEGKPLLPLKHFLFRKPQEVDLWLPASLLAFCYAHSSQLLCSIHCSGLEQVTFPLIRRRILPTRNCC